jgi:putative membrane protein
MRIIRYLLVLVGLILPVVLLAHSGGWGGGGGCSLGNFRGGGMMMILFWLVIIFLVGVSVRWLMQRKGQKAFGAVQVLEERYAKGEIDEQEFKEKRAVLKK